MAHQMSPPPRPAPRPFSPFQQPPAHSPPGIALPPAKRPKLSPGLNSPQATAGAFPESVYSPYPTPMAGSPTAFNTPQPYNASPPPGTMGPPPKPTPEQRAAKEKEEKEKVTDISDISDAMWGSGVDLREEENYLSSTSRTFDSQTTIASSNNSFNLLTQSTQPGSSYESSNLSQPSSLASMEAELDRKHQAAAIEYARQHELHLRDPFLLGNSMRHKIHKIAVDQAVHLDVKGLYEPTNSAPKPVQKPHQGVNGVVMTGGPADTGIAAVKAKSIPEAQHAFLEEGAKYADMLSLVSLAANERIRSLLDEALAISRGRRHTSHGVVPPDLQDMAVGQSRRSVSVRPESVTGSPWDRPKSSDGKPEPTVAFSTKLPIHLSSLAQAAHAAERARIKRRAERAARSQNNPAAPTDPDADADDPSGTSTPNADGLIAPDKPLTKKEREKMVKAGQTDEVLHKNANTTAAMQLGFGKKKKTYSWMTGGGAGAGAAGTNPFARPGGSSSSSKAGSGGDGERTGGAKDVKREGESGGIIKASGKAGLGAERKFGVFREDGDEGRGVQLRDLLAVLERDGKHRKSLERGWSRLDRDAAAS